MNNSAVAVASADTPQPQHVVELVDIRQTYEHGQKVVIDGLHLLIEKKSHHQFAVILGQSGCGKSTLLRYIAGLQEPTSGQVFLNGKLAGTKREVSMVFQQYSSMPWYTAHENVMLPLLARGMPKRDAREQAMKMIQAVGLEGHEHKYAMPPAPD